MATAYAMVSMYSFLDQQVHAREHDVENYTGTPAIRRHTRRLRTLQRVLDGANHTQYTLDVYDRVRAPPQAVSKKPFRTH